MPVSLILSPQIITIFYKLVGHFFLFFMNYFVPQNVHSIFTMKIKKKKTLVFSNNVKVVERVLRTVQFGEKDPFYKL